MLADSFAILDKFAVPTGASRAFLAPNQRSADSVAAIFKYEVDLDMTANNNNPLLQRIICPPVCIS